jgi:hypothetical protein
MDAYESEVWLQSGMADPMADITGVEKRQLKIADYIDGMMYCIQERQMGNLLIAPVFRVFYSYMNGLLWDAPDLYPVPGGEGAAHRLFMDLCGVWVAQLGEEVE